MKQNRSKRRKRSKRRSYGGLFRMGALGSNELGIKGNNPLNHTEATSNEKAERRKTMILFQDPAGGSYYKNAVNYYERFSFTTENRACNELEGYEKLACDRFTTYENESSKLNPDMYMLEQSLAEFIFYSYLVQDNASTMPAILWLYGQMAKIADKYPSSKPNWGESVFRKMYNKINPGTMTSNVKYLIRGGSKRRTRRR